MTYSSVPILPPAYRIVLRFIPLHFSAACFTGALVTDVIYWRTAEMTWANFSAWLLTAGLLLGGLAALAVVADVFLGRFRFAGASATLYLLGNIGVFVAALFNALIHGRDAWTSVVPVGLALSALTFVLMILVAVSGSVVKRRNANEG